jgi:ketosteroid isomerase-like protein
MSADYTRGRGCYGNVPITLNSALSLQRLQYPEAIGITVRCVFGEGILEKVTNEEIRKAVALFWSTFLAKSEDQLNSYYSPGSTVFQVAMGRSEPGRLGAMRRSREYFGPDTRMEVKLGPIEVALIGSDAGVASYTFSFQATGRDIGGGKRADEKLDLVRATHVFHRDAQGQMHILHEHFSVPVT